MPLFVQIMISFSVSRKTETVKITILHKTNKKHFDTDMCA